MQISTKGEKVSGMKTLIVDDQKRVKIPDAKPRQIFACETDGRGSWVLTLVRAKPQEPFPKGSLSKYFNRAKNKQELELLEGCSVEVE